MNKVRVAALLSTTTKTTTAMASHAIDCGALQVRIRIQYTLLVDDVIR